MGDWALCALRFELYLLTVAFKKDVNDPERMGIHTSHLGFYFKKYFKKDLVLKNYGKETTEELVDLVKEAVGIDESNGVLECKIEDGAPSAAPDFIKLQEENRRERERRIAAGDETVRLRFGLLKKAIQDKERA